MAQLILIHERKHPKIPKALLRQTFGDEVVVDDNGARLAAGVSVFIEGKIEDIRAWIKSAGGKVWTSNNPMAGQWELKEV